MDAQSVQSAVDILAPIAATYLPEATGAKIIAGITVASVASSAVLAIAPPATEGTWWDKVRKVLTVVALARGNATPAK